MRNRLSTLALLSMLFLEAAYAVDIDEQTRRCDIERSSLTNPHHIVGPECRKLRAMLETQEPAVVSAESSEARTKCESNHSETGEPVYGECLNGKFTGCFSRTGKPVYGKCVAHGKLRAYDPETAKMVLGRCD